MIQLLNNYTDGEVIVVSVSVEMRKHYVTFVSSLPDL